MLPSSSHTPMRGAAECASTTPCSRETSDCLRVGNHFPELGSPLPASSPTKLNDGKPNMQNPKPVRRGKAAGTCEIKRAILSENGAMVQKGLAIRRLAIAKQCTVLPALKEWLTAVDMLRVLRLLNANGIEQPTRTLALTLAPTVAVTRTPTPTLHRHRAARRLRGPR